MVYFVQFPKHTVVKDIHYLQVSYYMTTFYDTTKLFFGGG